MNARNAVSKILHRPARRRSARPASLTPGDRPRLVRAIGGVPQSRGRCWGTAIGLVAVAAVVDRLTYRVLGYETPFMFYYPAVFAAGLFSGFGPGLLATVLSAAAAVFLDLEPFGTAKLAVGPDAIRLAAFLAIGVGTSALTHFLRRTTRVMAERETRFRTLIEGTRDYAILVLDPDGVILSWNAGAELMTGYRSDEMIGRNFSLFYPPGVDASVPKKSLRTAAEKGRLEEEGWRRRKDGSLFWAGSVVNAVRDDAGVLVGFSKVTRDLTERKAAEEALKAKDEELRRRAEKLEKAVDDLESFSYTISHDLRAPLRAVEGYAYFLMKAGLTPGDRALVERISASTARMDGLIQDLLTYSRIGRGNGPLTPLDLDDVVARVLEQYPLPDGARARVGARLGRVMGQESLLIQCLSNLLDNAVKFVPEGRAPELVVSTERRDGKVIVSVRDNGIGIERELQGRIFEPFVRLHPGDYQGTGIGLAIVKRAVERMGGRAGVESRQGEGSRFWIELPEAR